MQSCQYIDISASQWVASYADDPRLTPMTPRLPASKHDVEMLLVFGDKLPAETDIQEWVWRVIETGTQAFLVLLDNPTDVNSCWRLLHRGITDIFIWEGIDSLFRLLETKNKRWKKIKSILESSLIRDNLIGDSRVWKHFLSTVVEAAIFSHSNILIHGESGTGKELISRLVHGLDERPQKGKLILVDCTTIVPELSGSEFFGHEKGSYTSSVTSREGAFALANKGTLFLDEISELPLPLQAELLRAIQEKTYKRVGSNTWHSTNFRLICATNKSLESLVAEGKFRQDLYYRIADVELHVPALRDHQDDITTLAKYFLYQFCQEAAIPEIPTFESSVLHFIANREYRGNIRELRQVVRRIAMNHSGGNYISLGSIPLQDRPVADSSSQLYQLIDSWEASIKRAILSGESLMEIKNIAAYLAIKIAIDMEKGDKQKAADRLHVTLRAVQQYTKKHQTIA